MHCFADSWPCQRCRACTCVFGSACVHARLLTLSFPLSYKVSASVIRAESLGELAHARGVKHACSVHHGTHSHIFTRGSIHEHVQCVLENTSIRQVLGWGGMLMVLMSAVCLPVLFNLMKEVKGEWLKIEDYLHYSCVIIEKT